MKNWTLLIFITLSFAICRSQSFYYVDEDSPNREFIKQTLISSSQFVTENPFESEYRIKTGVSADDQSGLTVKFKVVDSLTFETIFYAQETYKVTRLKNRYSAFTTESNSFFGKNIKAAITSSKYHTFYKLHNLVKSRKDKTYH